MSSVAQMLGENEDSYVQSCIQTQSTGIACETLLTLQLLESGEHAEGRNYGNTELSISRLGRGLSNVMSHCGENQNSRPSETDLV